MTKLLLRLAAVVAVGVGASACSSVPSWVDPTTWVDDGSTAGDGQAPDLADIPGKPQTTTSDDRQRAADSLTADRSQATYSADALKAEAENSAPPPPPAPPPSAATSSDEQASATDETKTAQALPPAETPAPAAEPQAAPTTRIATADEAPALPTRSASLSAPAAPPPASGDSDASLGFRPSSAPPLDPSVSQFVSPTLLRHYQQTASLSPSATTDDPPPPVASRSRRHRQQAMTDGVGGPEGMSGDVVANMDALESAPSASLATYADQSGNSPVAVVFFPGDGTALNAASRAKVKSVVKAYKQGGNQGFIKVVGHSSSRTKDMPIEKHLALVFKLSQDRANAVAHELIREGIPADKVLVNAVGDSQPVYYESMPAGEEGNRRAEIFLQS